MRISVFGLGYVGAVTASCLAKAGHHVTGVDINPDKVSTINAGRSPIIEPGLAELVSRVVASGNLRATTSAAEAVSASDAGLICVGTPPQRNGQPNVDALERVSGDIGRALSRRFT